jgi:hypothetical protein
MTIAELPQNIVELPLNITLDYYRTISSNEEYNAMINVLEGKLSYCDVKPI